MKKFDVKKLKQWFKKFKNPKQEIKSLPCDKV